MEKKSALFISLLILSIILIDTYYFSHKDMSPKLEKATIQRVIDGDTLILDNNKTIRLLNINAPEKSSILAHYAYDYLKELENKKVLVQLNGKDKYNRYLARIYSDDNSYVNLILVKKGFSLKFLVDLSELKKFKDAELDAINSEVGIWRKSAHFGCLNESVDMIKEIVTITNACNNSPINLSGWLLRDESRKQYVLPSRNLSSGESIFIHSFQGTDNSTDLFWDSKENIWNDDRDTAYIFDEFERVSAYYVYGY